MDKDFSPKRIKKKESIEFALIAFFLLAASLVPVISAFADHSSVLVGNQGQLEKAELYWTRTCYLRQDVVGTAKLLKIYIDQTAIERIDRYRFFQLLKVMIDYAGDKSSVESCQNLLLHLSKNMPSLPEVECLQGYLSVKLKERAARHHRDTHQKS